MEDSKELRIFLEKLNLERYFDTFVEEGFETNEDLKVLKEEDLDDLEVKTAHKRRILTAIEELKSIKDKPYTKDLSSSNIPTLIQPLTVNLTLKQLNGQFLNACQGGELNLAIELINKGANAFDKALCCACSGGHKEVAFEIIKRGATNFNKAFLISCKSGNRELAVDMILKGATNLGEGLEAAKLRNNEVLFKEIALRMEHQEYRNLKEIPIVPVKKLNSYLLNAAQSGQLDKIKQLVQQGANAFDKALCCACSGGHGIVAEYLLSIGAKDVNSAFLAACKSGNREMVLKMAKLGASNFEKGLEMAKLRKDEDIEFEINKMMKEWVEKLDSIKIPEIINKPTESKLDPSTITQESQKIPQTNNLYFVQKPSETNTQQNSTSFYNSRFNTASPRSDNNVAFTPSQGMYTSNLSSYDYKPNISEEDIQFQKELNDNLIKACKSGNYISAKTLIKRGAVVAECCLVIASQLGYKDIVDLLLQSGSFRLNKALNVASQSGHFEIVDELIKKGANDLETSFRCACAGRQLKIASFLLEKGVQDRQNLFTKTFGKN